jgi:hypothetical protein
MKLIELKTRQIIFPELILPILNKNTKIAKQIILCYDTEYTQNDSMIVDVVGFRTSEVKFQNYTYHFLYEDILDNTFHPIYSYFSLIRGMDVRPIQYELDNITELLMNIESDFDTTKKVTVLNKEIKQATKYDELLKEYGLDVSKLIFIYDKEDRSNILNINHEKVNTTHISLLFHAAEADLFKIGGTLWHNDIKCELTSDNGSKNLSHYRTLRFTSNPYNPKATAIRLNCIINNVFYSIYVDLLDTMHVYPPAEKSLENQLNVFFAGKIKKMEINHDKSQMTTFRHKHETKFLQYNSSDVDNTYRLYKEFEKFHKDIGEELNAVTEMTQTCGSNVARIIKSLMITHFSNNSNLENCNLDNFKKIKKDKKRKITVTDIVNFTLKEGVARTLQELDFNRYGVQHLLTSGGLIYSRMSQEGIVEGTLLDLDYKSCYSNIISSGMNIYNGQPIIHSTDIEDKAMTIREVHALIKHKNIPNDAWYLKASGVLSYENTLVLSTLQTSKKKERLKNYMNKLKRNPRLIANFNLEKVAKELQTTKPLTKKIHMGSFTQDTLDALQYLLPTMYDEILNLKVMFLAYYEPTLICDTLEEYCDKIGNSDLYDKNYTIELNSNLLTTKHQVLCSNNVSLRYPIYETWKKLKDIREIYKTAKNPIQEIYKLIGNSAYGVFACLYLPLNNPIASNYITSKARSQTWLMTNAVNAYAPITDGSCFNYNTIPFGLQFRDLLQKNPNYLTKYDSTITHNYNITDFEKFFHGEDFLNHLKDFYNMSEKPEYKFELKPIKYTTEDNIEKESIVFHKYYHSGCGNYLQQIITQDNKTYDDLNMRGYIETPELIENYKNNLENGYYKPYIHTEERFLKVADATREVMAYFDIFPELEELCYPCGFSKKVFKIQKLISPSQFQLQSEKQFNYMEKHFCKLSNLFKELIPKSIFLKYWECNSKMKYKKYSLETIWSIAKRKSVGYGFEIYSISSKYKNNVTYLRKDLQSYIDKTEKLNISSFLNSTRILKNLPEVFITTLMSVALLKIEEDLSIYELLINSIKEPHNMIIKRNEVKRLSEIIESSYEE